MATLRGEQALQYLLANPNARITKGQEMLDPSILGQLQSQNAPQTKPQRGFLDNLLRGITDPVRDTIGGLEYLTDIGGQLASGKNLAEVAKNEKNFKSTQHDAGEFEQFKNDPLGGFKNAAQIMAYAMPGGGQFGGGFGGAIKSGLASGGLTGFGTSKSTDTAGLLKDILLGAGMGGATSGVFFKGGELINKFKNRNNVGLGGFYQGNTIPKDVDPVKKLQDFGLLDSNYKVPGAAETITGKASANQYNQIVEKISKLKDPLQREEAGRALLSILPEDSMGQQIADITKLTTGVDDAGQFVQAPDVLGNLKSNVKSLPQGITEKGRVLEWKNLGARPGTVKKHGLAVLDKFEGDLDALDNGLKLTGLVDEQGNPLRNLESLGELKDRLGQMRAQTLVDKPITLKQSEIVGELADIVATRTGKTRAQARELISQQFNRLQRNPSELLSDNIDQFDLNKLSIELGSDAQKVRTTVGDVRPEKEAARAVQEYASNRIKNNSPLYKQTTRSFEALYNQLDNIIKQSERQTSISPFGGRQILNQNIVPFAERKLYQGMQKGGDLLDKLLNAGKGIKLPGNVNLPQLTQSQRDKLANNLLPILLTQNTVGQQ